MITRLGLFAFVTAFAVGSNGVSADQGRSQPSHPRDTTSTLIGRFLASDVPPLVTYSGTRTLTASTRGGRMSASIDARTWVAEDGAFHYEVTREEGSGTIRRHVLIAALEAERKAREEKSTGANLTPMNYEFDVSPDGSTELLKIDLHPLRKSPMLLDGAMYTTPDSVDLVRVEGALSKRPSFWTRHVEIMRRYARLNGVRVPVEMTSRADVLIVGESIFSMTYKYDVINGMPLP